MLHHIPELLDRPIKKALSYYPSLNNVEIEFRLVEPIGKSFMQAQPRIMTFLIPGKRSYLIKISRQLRLNTSSVPVEQIPEDVLIGWFGHELGHIIDFETRGIRSMILYGLGYWLSRAFIKKAEFAADTFAIRQGLASYLVATKNFILEHTDINEGYKTKIRKLYMSPEEVLRHTQSLGVVA